MADYALIIAMNDYPRETGQRQLNGAVADAVDFSEWVLDPAGGGVEKENFFFWSHPDSAETGPLLTAALAGERSWPTDSRPDFDDPPDDRAIMRASEALAKRARTDQQPSRAYLFFAGHGVQIVERDYNKVPETCFVAGNFEPGTSIGLVPLGDLLRLLERTGPEQTILLQDCCRSDLPPNANRPTLIFNPINDQQLNKQWVLGNAARGGQTAFEVPIDAPSRGAFSKVLIQALRQFRPEGGLSAQALRGFVSQGVSSLVVPRTQRPEIKVRYDEEECVLAEGPPIGKNPHISVSIPGTRAGGPVDLMDYKGNVIATIADGQNGLTMRAPVGIYMLVDRQSGEETSVFHIGPENTDVSL